MQSFKGMGNRLLRNEILFMGLEPHEMSDKRFPPWLARSACPPHEASAGGASRRQV